jgi:site-specific DNA recombinase
MQMVERQGRANNADAGAGNWKGGRRPFGYEADGVTINEIEKSHILEAVERMLAGESPRSIAGDWNRRNIPTSAGNAWHPGALAKVLGSARIAGKRVHNKVVVGPAVWEGIIDEVTHKRVVAVLKSRTPVGRRGRTPWLLTGLLRCGHCEATLVGNTDSRNGVRRYVCRKAPGYHGCGKLGIKAEPLEDLLGFLVGDRSVDIAARRAAQTGPDDAAEQAELDELTVLRDEADEDRRTKKIDRAEFDRRVAKFDVWQRDIYARLAAKTVTAAPLDLLADEEFMGRPWKELTVTEKRRKLDALIVGVSVAPASSRGSTRFEAARVRGGIGWRI